MTLLAILKARHKARLVLLVSSVLIFGENVAPQLLVLAHEFEYGLAIVVLFVLYLYELDLLGALGSIATIGIYSTPNHHSRNLRGCTVSDTQSLFSLLNHLPGLSLTLFRCLPLLLLLDLFLFFPITLLLFDLLDLLESLSTPSNRLTAQVIALTRFATSVRYDLARVRIRLISLIVESDNTFTTLRLRGSIARLLQLFYGGASKGVLLLLCRLLSNDLGI